MIKNVKEQFSLEGKVVLITGGAGFLGRYFAEAVAEMGAYPILLDKSTSHLSKAEEYLLDKGYKTSIFALDILDSKLINEVIKSIVKVHKSIDILINAAAFALNDMQKSTGNFFADFEDYDEKLWQMALNVNLTGTFLVTQSVGKVMRKNKSGVIVNLASDLAIISPDQRIYKPDKRFDYDGVDFNSPISYTVSKSGILAFTRFLATYWAEEGIRVNSLSPAGVYRNHDSKFVEQLAFRIPLGRMAEPEELKGPLIFLCSDASSFMTGSNLVIDGGRTAW